MEILIKNQRDVSKLRFFRLAYKENNHEIR